MGQPRDDKQAIAFVRCARFGSRQHIPPCIVPERGQVTEYRSKGSASVHGKQPWNVLDRHEPRTNSAKHSRKLGPEPTRIALATAATSDACRLAREPATHDVDGLELVDVDGSNISKSNCIWPMFSEDLRAELIVLDLPSNRSEAGHLKASLEAANSREERADSGHGSPPLTIAGCGGVSPVVCISRNTPQISLRRPLSAYH